MIGGAVALVLVVLLVLRRRRRNVLAGRDGNKPTYAVEAPGRRLAARSKEVL